MKNKYLLIILPILVFLSLLSCSPSEPTIELSLDVKDYPFLKDNEIGIDVKVKNPNEFVILTSNFNTRETGDISLIYKESGVEHKLKIHRRISEDSRGNIDKRNAKSRIQITEALDPDEAVTHKLIAVHSGNIKTDGEIKAKFVGPVYTLEEGLSKSRPSTKDSNGLFQDIDLSHLKFIDSKFYPVVSDMNLKRSTATDLANFEQGHNDTVKSGPFQIKIADQKWIVLEAGTEVSKEGKPAEIIRDLAGIELKLQIENISETVEKFRLEVALAKPDHKPLHQLMIYPGQEAPEVESSGTLTLQAGEVRTIEMHSKLTDRFELLKAGELVLIHRYQPWEIPVKPAPKISLTE